MKEHKTIENGFTWVPPEKRTSRFGGPMPPRKPENRIPVYWLARDGNELYFVNASQETLAFVETASGGFQTVDDDVTVSAAGGEYAYKNVRPGSAVKVDEYDGYYDLDFMVQVSVMVQSASRGCLQIRSPLEKGGIRETVLLWDSGESGRHVFLKSCD